MKNKLAFEEKDVASVANPNIVIAHFTCCNNKEESAGDVWAVLPWLHNACCQGRRVAEVAQIFWSLGSKSKR